jgi:hypothetical protein
VEAGPTASAAVVVRDRMSNTKEAWMNRYLEVLKKYAVFSGRAR